MSFAVLLLSAQLVSVPASGIPQAIPATAFNCNLQSVDGSKFSASGITPDYPAGSDPNEMKFVALNSTHPEAFVRRAGIAPGEASEWFREFQVSSGYPGVPQYRMNLMLRKEGASIAYVTRYMETGKQIPYEYHAVGLCSALFAPAAPAERGEP